MARPSNPELRNEILKAAAFIIEDCGPDCVTMRQVAEKIGYSPTTIYLYFKDKGDLLRAAVLAAFEDLAEACDAATVGPGLLDKIRQRSRAYVVWGVMHPGHYRLMFESSEEVRFTAEDGEAMERSLRPGYELVRQAIDAGEIEPCGDAVRTAQTIWAGLHGATSLAISGRLAPGMDGMSATQVLETATSSADCLINSIIAS